MWGGQLAVATSFRNGKHAAAAAIAAALRSAQCPSVRNTIEVHLPTSSRMLGVAELAVACSTVRAAALCLVPRALSMHASSMHLMGHQETMCCWKTILLRNCLRQSSRRACLAASPTARVQQGLFCKFCCGYRLCTQTSKQHHQSWQCTLSTCLAASCFSLSPTDVKPLACTWVLQCG